MTFSENKLRRKWSWKGTCKRRQFDRQTTQWINVDTGGHLKYNKVLIRADRTLAKRLECSPMARETWVQSQVESYQRLKKWYLMPPCLTLSIIRYGSRVKWSNPGKGVAPSPTPWCSKLSKREPSGHPRLWSPTTNTCGHKQISKAPAILLANKT